MSHTMVTKSHHRANQLELSGLDKCEQIVHIVYPRVEDRPWALNVGMPKRFEARNSGAVTANQTKYANRTGHR